MAQSLRSSIIHLASEHPEFRKGLLPLLKKQGARSLVIPGYDEVTPEFIKQIVRKHPNMQVTFLQDTSVSPEQAKADPDSGETAAELLNHMRSYHLDSHEVPYMDSRGKVYLISIEEEQYSEIKF